MNHIKSAFTLHTFKLVWLFVMLVGAIKIDQSETPGTDQSHPGIPTTALNQQLVNDSTVK